MQYRKPYVPLFEETMKKINEGFGIMIWQGSMETLYSVIKNTTGYSSTYEFSKEMDEQTFWAIKKLFSDGRYSVEIKANFLNGAIPSKEDFILDILNSSVGIRHPKIANISDATLRIFGMNSVIINSGSVQFKGQYVNIFALLQNRVNI